MPSSIVERTVFVIILDLRKAGKIDYRVMARASNVDILMETEDLLRQFWAMAENPPKLQGKPMMEIRSQAELRTASDKITFRTFDAYGRKLHDRRVGGIPVPGVVIAFVGEFQDDGRGWGSGDDVYSFFAKNAFEQGCEASESLKSYMSSTAPAFDPSDYALYDVFLSYAAADAALCRELQESLSSAGLRCFVAASDVVAGSRWTDEIRKALIGSTVVMLVLSPRSRDSKWVMGEAGAAWALGKVILPALSYTAPSELPELISQYQAVNIETQSDRDRIREIAVRLCRR
jgi:hypothetical protein